MFETFALHFWKAVFSLGLLVSCAVFFIGAGKKASVLTALQYFFTSLVSSQIFFYLFYDRIVTPVLGFIIALIVAACLFFGIGAVKLQMLTAGRKDSE